MKIFNLLKKETTNTKKVSVQKLKKTQLNQIIGGGDGTVNSSTDMAITKSGGATKGGTYGDKKI